MEGLRESGVVWSAELSRALRSARVLVLLGLYGLCAAMALSVVGQITQSLEEGVRQQAGQADPSSVEQGLVEARARFVRGFFSDDEALAEALVQLPLVLLVVFKMSLRFLPLLIGLMGFDQLAGELGPKSLRYLAVRSRRSSVLLGKLLSQATLLAGLTLLVDLGLSLWTGAGFLTFLKLWGTSLVFCLPYLALTALLSASTRQPALSLIGNLVALVGIWFVAAVGGFFSFSPATDPSLGVQPPVSSAAYLRFLSVWYYAQDLMHPRWAKWGLATAAHLGFAATFLAAAHVVLRKRDL